MSTRSHPRTPPTRGARALLLGLGAGLAVALAAAAAHADGTVYKWTDAQGRVHYSDRPPADGEGQAVPINTGYSKSPKTSAPTPAAAARSQPKPGDGAPVPASVAEKKVAADLAAAHQGDCKKATDTYNTYIRVRHLYKPGDDQNGGERQFLSDAELDQARVDARREMDEACANSGQ